MDSQQFSNPFSSAEFKESFFSKKNIITFLLVGITLLVIPVAVKLGKEQQLLKTQATGEEISFVASDTLECDDSGSCTTKTTEFEVDLLSLFGPPGELLPTGVPSATPGLTSTPPPSGGTTTPPPAATGPCTGNSPCTFSSRFLFLGSDNSLQESITAYGKYWNWKAAPGSNNFVPMSGNNSQISSVSRYAQGPCQGQSLQSCDFNTHSVFTLADGSLQESVTAYGKYWNWKAAPGSNNFVALSGNGAALTSVARYAQGPCAGKSGEDCRFDTHFVLKHSDGSLQESVTAYGKYWNWKAASGSNVFNAMSGNGSNLETVARYAQGPCAGKAAGDCRFDTHTVLYLSDNSIQESVTAYGKYWNWKAAAGSNNFQPMSGNGSALTSVERYGK